jgi:Cu-Zn family superoxide dismutase
MKKLTAATLTLLVPALVLGAWATQESGPAAAKAKMRRAVAVLHHSSNSKVHGVIHFVQKGEAVEVNGEVHGLTPGAHGFHIHEFGDCTSPDASSAGGHFNPGHKMHGGPHAADRHEGDLGNIKADASGTAKIHFSDKMLHLSGKDSILGRSVIVHADPDDLKSQPSGNAGARVACGVVGWAKE